MLIFVSYSSKDREQVEALVVELGLHGHDVHFEQKVPGGRLRWEQLFESIQRCDIFVFTITQNTLVSYSRLLEYEYALTLGKTVLAIQFQKVDLSLLPPGIAGVIDYEPCDPALPLRAAFAQTLSRLQKSVSINEAASPPSLNYLLWQLRDRIAVPNKNDEEKAVILLNLQELLERQETYFAAAEMLDDFALDIGPDEAIARIVQAERKRIHRRATSSKRHIRTLVVFSLLLLVGTGAFLFIRDRQPSETNNRSGQTGTSVVIGSTETRLDMQTAATDEALSVVSQRTMTEMPETSVLLPTLGQVSGLGTAERRPTVLTRTPQPTATRTVVPSLTKTFTATVAPSATPSSTSRFSATSSVLPSATPTYTTTSTALPSATPSFTATPTALPSATATLIPSRTFTASPTSSPSSTFTQTASATSVPSATRTFTASPTRPRPSTTATSTPSVTPSPTKTPTRTSTVDIDQFVPETVYVGITVEDALGGARVSQAGRNATSAGVMEGDIVLAVDLDDVTSADEFRQEMNQRNPFGRVNLRLRRNNGIVSAIITLGIEDYVAATATPVH